VVDKVLRATASACVTAPAAFVVQTEEGSPTGSDQLHRLQRRQHQGQHERQHVHPVRRRRSTRAQRGRAGLPRTFALDNGSGSDTSPPTTSITSPASGATVSGVITVAASASDNVGVTRVEFYRDGALAATDTTAPYQWSWNTATAANGSHTLFTRAFDAAGNTGTSASRTVTVNNPTDLDISGWRLVQTNSAITYTLPAGTRIPSSGYVVIARNASKSAFEAFWRGGTPLPSNVDTSTRATGDSDQRQRELRAPQRIRHADRRHHHQPVRGRRPEHPAPRSLPGGRPVGQLERARPLRALPAREPRPAARGAW
jgi:hypothetical protein